MIIKPCIYDFMAGVARGAAEQITAKQQVQGVYNTQTSIITITYYLIYWQYYCMVPGISSFS